ncbi:hypothetical protein AB0I84_10500 [Streptomyces spectabilis]|uniref:hypothetical protein n=1 Tax=Streptomyces spectabilis TaxID=68270 RepID=UPI0033D9BB49
MTPPFPAPETQYAWAFAQYAAEWARQNPDGTLAAFCTSQHSAFIAASSLAFDRDDFDVCLETAMLLTSLGGQPETDR